MFRTRRDSLRSVPSALVAALLLAAPGVTRAQDGTESAIDPMLQALAKPPVLVTLADVPPEIEALPGAEQATTLLECIDAALETNPALEAERIRREELDGQMVQARSIGLPNLDLAGSWSRGRDPSFALDTTLFPEDLDDPSVPAFSPIDVVAQSFWRASADASWELRPGLVYNAMTAAGLGIDRQDTIIEGAEQTTVESVMRGYYDVVVSGELLLALDSEISAREEFLEIARRRYRVQMGTPLDTLQAAVSLANLQPERRRSVQRLRNTGAALNVLIGQHPLNPITVVRELILEEDPLDFSSFEESVTERPDLKEIEYWEQILRKNRGAQKAEFRPYLSVDGSYGFVGKAVDDLTSDGHDVWSARVAVTVPLFDGMLTKGKVEETEASIRRTEQEWEDARRNAHLEVLQLNGDLEAARDNLVAARLNVASGDQVFNQTNRRYQLGKADYLEVLNAQGDRFSARSNLIQARYEVLTLTAALKRALGLDPRTPLSQVGEALSR